MRISDWSSDVCSSDLLQECAFFRPRFDQRHRHVRPHDRDHQSRKARTRAKVKPIERPARRMVQKLCGIEEMAGPQMRQRGGTHKVHPRLPFHEKRSIVREPRSEEHTSELQSLMRSSYAVFCLKKKNNIHV